MSKYHSRHQEFNKETCVKNAGGNQFDLIIMGSQRAREIKAGNSHSNKMEHRHGVMTALLEIQSGQIDREYWKKIK
jgi:DNA-directed RNA polymerase subunit K/omega